MRTEYPKIAAPTTAYLQPPRMAPRRSHGWGDGVGVGVGRVGLFLGGELVGDLVGVTRAGVVALGLAVSALRSAASADADGLGVGVVVDPSTNGFAVPLTPGTEAEAVSV